MTNILSIILKISLKDSARSNQRGFRHLTVNRIHILKKNCTLNIGNHVRRILKSPKGLTDFLPETATKRHLCMAFKLIGNIQRFAKAELLCESEITDLKHSIEVYRKLITVKFFINITINSQFEKTSDFRNAFQI